MPNFNEFMFGQKEEMQQVPTMNPQQQQYMSMLLQQLMGSTGGGFNYLKQLLSDDPEAMQQFEAPYMRQFQEQTIPQLAERFSGVGAQNSSAFTQQLGQAGAGLSENLASLKMGLKSQALSQLMGMGQLATQPQFNTALRPSTPGFLGNLAQGASQGIGMAGMAHFYK